MDILRRENKLFILLFVVASLFFTACKRYKEYNVKEIATIRESCIKVSQTILGKNEYYSIYQMANDSIINWSKNELGKWKYFGNLTDYQLDSVFCVNKTGNRIIFSILRRTIIDDADGDGISYFYGVKIRNNWYFFEGEYMVLLREYYQEDIHTPLSFEKLKQIITSYKYRHYLNKNKQGQWEINEKFFATFNYDAYNYPFTTQEAWDESWLKLCRENWSKKDTTNYE